MPLLNRKRVPLSPVIPYDPKRKRKEVWYLRFTNEVFTSYESYINKLTLYHQAIWECEATGRKNLTYEQALESEKTEHDRAEYQFCPALRKAILNKVQYRTLKLDDLVKDILNYLNKNFVVDEIVRCKLNDYEYFSKIVEIINSSDQKSNYNNNNSHSSSKNLFIATASTSNSETEDEVYIPRQPNGRLRFPDAFIHPVPQSPTQTERSSSEELTQPKQFKVQLLDNMKNPLETCTRLVEEHQIYREKFLLTRLNLQKFIRECCYKDTMMNSPWLIKESIATTYGLTQPLPEETTEITTKKRKLTQTKSADEKEAEKRARREESLLLKAKLKEERERLKEEKKRQAAIKYPLEDLDLPIYRKDQWQLIDMAPDHYPAQHMTIPFPKAGKPDRPSPHRQNRIPSLDSFLSIWTFMTVFAEPLKISAFSLDEFEQALFHTSHQPKATVLVEYNAALLNVIIKERQESTMSLNDLMSGEVMEEYVASLEEKDKDEEEGGGERLDPLESTVLPRVERGWRDRDVLKMSQKWDHKELRANYDRRGWETCLIGCLNDVATPDLIQDLDRLIQHLVPKQNASAADREKQYPTLTVQQKLDILRFLIDVVNESNLIKNYMDYCQEQLTEFRKQKVELNKESKILASKRIQLDKRDRLEKSQEASGEESEESEESEDSSSSSSESDLESDSSESRVARLERRHQSRQSKLKQKKEEREEMERLRRQHYAEQREVAKAKNQEQRMKANERKKLEEEEKAIKKKEEHLERSMRRYMTLRIRPLGKDRFNNRYFYFDDIGVSDTYGTGRVYVNSPSDGDIQLMMERDYMTDLPEVPWGYGGGSWFIKKLMQEQGLIDECQWLEKRMNELNSENSPEYLGWWSYYSEPEEIEQLIEWLNPKGIRELKLKNELIRLQPYIVKSMKKRAQAQTKSESVTKRTRARAAANNVDTWSTQKFNKS